MITTIWDSAVTYTQENSPFQTPATNKKVGQLQIPAGPAASGILLQQIDLGTVQNVGDNVAIELEIQNLPGSAPAAGDILTIWAACSSSGSKQPPELLTAASSQACPASQVLGRTQVFMLPVFYMAARYLYVWFDMTAFSAAVNLRLRINAKKA